MTELAELFLCAVGVLLLRLFILSFARVKGRSMLPTLENWDWLLVWRLSYRTGRPKRQDVVICRYPGRCWRNIRFLPLSFVKRVIGLPGETVEVIDGVVHINGRPLYEPYLDPRRTRFQRNRPPITLGPDEYFVLGDNRDSSNDSRRVGPLKRQAIRGRICFALRPLNRILKIR